MSNEKFHYAATALEDLSDSAGLDGIHYYASTFRPTRAGNTAVSAGSAPVILANVTHRNNDSRLSVVEQGYTAQILEFVKQHSLTFRHLCEVSLRIG
jgi:hypothetical protein